MKLGRRYSFPNKHVSWQSHRVAVLTIHVVLGISRGWRKSFDTCPLFAIRVSELGMIIDDAGVQEIPDLCPDGDAAPVPEPARGPADAAPEPKRRKTVCESNECLRKVRSAHVNTMHFATTVFARFTQLRQVDAATGLQEEVVLVFKMRLTEAKTRRGLRQLFVDLAGGLWSTTSSKAWGKLSDPEFIRRLGFKASIEQTPQRIAADKEVSQVVFDMLMSMSEKFLVWEQEHTHGLPLFAAKLLSRDVAKRRSASRDPIPIPFGKHSKGEARACLSVDGPTLRPFSRVCCV
jgi:hypothetical protein